MPGSAAPYCSHWVVPVLAENRQALIAALAAAGFDATSGSSMCVADAPYGEPDLAATMTRQVFERLVYLPCYPAMSLAALVKMTGVLAAQQGNIECFSALSASAGLGGKSPTVG